MSSPSKPTTAQAGSPQKPRVLTAEELANIPRPTRSVQPNCMAYTDDKGTEKRIYLPKGTSEAASNHLAAENWEELAKFEPYTNQGYTEEDYDYVKADPEETVV